MNDTLKPWMEKTSHGWLLCLCCPTDKTRTLSNGFTVRYFLGIKLKRCSRKKLARWLRVHRHCGFE